LASIGITTLCNSGRIIKWGDGQCFLGGIDDAYYGSPDIKGALEDRPERTGTVLLNHSPVRAYPAQYLRYDLVLAGHTHGGHVRIHWYGAIMTPPESGSLQMGLYHLRRTKLHVNRGIGNSICPGRLFCPPEVTYLTILPSRDAS
jgi:predicted MPP superfamily phosphohydrolase